MKLIVKLLLSSVLVLPILTTALLVLVVEDKPMLRARPDITPEQIARGKIKTVRLQKLTWIKKT